MFKNSCVTSAVRGLPQYALRELSPVYRDAREIKRKIKEKKKRGGRKQERECSRKLAYLLAVRRNYHVHLVEMLAVLRDLCVNFPSVVREIDLLAGYEARAGDGAEARADQVAVRVFGAGTRRPTAGHRVEAHGVTSLRCNAEA